MSAIKSEFNPIDVIFYLGFITALVEVKMKINKYPVTFYGKLSKIENR